MRTLEAWRVLDVQRIRIHIIIQALSHSNGTPQKLTEKAVRDFSLLGGIGCNIRVHCTSCFNCVVPDGKC